MEAVSGPPAGRVAESPGSDPMAEVVHRVRQITREHEALYQELIEGERRFRTLARAVWKVQEEERRRLARELHDGLGQTLTALKNQLEHLRRDSGSLAPELEGRLGDAVELAHLALNETRELSRLLRPPILDDLGLQSALRWLARTFRQRTGLRVDLLAEGLEERLDADLETLIFRLVQEGLTNVLKHAGVESAAVEIARQDRWITLRITDGGRGFDPALALAGTQEGSGSGLRGMRDRVALFGGRFHVVSGPGRGTTLEVQIPQGDPPEEVH